MTQTFKSPLLLRALALSLVMASAPSPMPIAAAQSQSETPAWLTCPNTLEVNLRPSRDGDPARIREVAPRAGGQTSTALYGDARFASVAYQLYNQFDAGQNPWTAFAEPSLALVSLIYGVPGRDTERRGGPTRTRTLYGFVADDRATGRRYIVFRGTQEPAEWVRNVQAGQRPFPSGTPRRGATANVHAGFLEIFDSLELESRDGVLLFASALPGLINGRDAVFVGHSLGSALATLAGVDAGQRAPAMAPRIRVVTLASPRVGDAGFATMAARLGRIDRVCNLVDIVTAVPPNLGRATYVHVGTPFRVSSFDWPTMANDLDSSGEQIGCWHSDVSYLLMLNPNHRLAQPSSCYRTGA